MSDFMKLKPEVKAIWLAALRSGKYQQGRAALQNNEGFCCLGVLCDLFRNATDSAMDWHGTEDNITFGYTQLDSDLAYPPPPVYEWAFDDYTGQTRAVKLQLAIQDEEDEYTVNNLVDCNDELKLDFNHIADIIEEQL